MNLECLPAYCASAAFALLSFANAAKTDDPRFALGEYLSGECVACHRIDGNSKGIPPIIGWEPALFSSAMLEYRNKARSNEAMRVVASRLQDEEIAALAAYFSTIKPAQ